MSDKEETLNQIYQLIASVRENGSYPAESFVKGIIDDLLISYTDKMAKLRDELSPTNARQDDERFAYDKCIKIVKETYVSK